MNLIKVCSYEPCSVLELPGLLLEEVDRRFLGFGDVNFLKTGKFSLSAEGKSADDSKPG